MSQKCKGGLWVNGTPPSVGRKNEPPIRISRTTSPYFVSSPTKSPLWKGVRNAEIITKNTAPESARRDGTVRLNLLMLLHLGTTRNVAEGWRARC